MTTPSQGRHPPHQRTEARQEHRQSDHSRKNPRSRPEAARWPLVEAPIEYRGSTRQVCGLWPFGTGAAAPAVGAPLGRHLYTGNTVCFDPISWFTHTNLINSPSVHICGEPGMGKSTAVRRMIVGLADRGVTSIIPGDLKPDYARLVQALGGQVVKVGPGLDRLNPLDAGPWQHLMSTVDTRTAVRVRAAVVDRRVNLISALVTLIRHGAVTANELTVLTAAVRLITDREDGVHQPTLGDVWAIIRDAPDEVRAVTSYVDTDEIGLYRQDVAPLQRTLLALLHGPLADTFAGPSTIALDLGRPAVCVDISHIDEADPLRTAAALITTWSYAFAQVDAAHLLADTGHALQRTFFCVLDEMWRALGAGHGLVDRVNALTRLNRQRGTGLAMITHSVADGETLSGHDDRAKARGFAQRCAVLMVGACSPQELDAITAVRELSDAERREVLSWSSPPSWTTGGATPPVGLGNFLLKVGSRPGIPVRLAPTAAEKRLGDTNLRWHDKRGGFA